MRFCDNPKCPNHITVLYGRGLLVQDHHGNRHKLTQHSHVFPDNGVAHFCDWCNEAINMYDKMMRDSFQKLKYRGSY